MNQSIQKNNATQNFILNALIYATTQRYAKGLNSCYNPKTFNPQIYVTT